MLHTHACMQMWRYILWNAKCTVEQVNFHMKLREKKSFFSLKEFIAQFQTVWCNLQLGVPLCIAGGDKGMSWVAEIWSSSLLWCGMRTRSCAEAQTHDSRVIDCFGPDTSADGSHCFYSLLFRLLSPPFALFLDSPASISHCVSRWLTLVNNRWNYCMWKHKWPPGPCVWCQTILSCTWRAYWRRTPVPRFICSCLNPSWCQLSIVTKRLGRLSKAAPWSGFNPALYESQQALHTATAGAHLKVHSRVSLPL